MARPKIQIDKKNFEGLCKLQCTILEVADFFDCSEDTIENWCKRTYKQSFSGVFAKKRCGGKRSIRRKQYEIAMSGDRTMLIWLGKQYLGQSDKITNDDSEDGDSGSDYQPKKS